MKQACSKRKLFKTPGSVNYRRMLPYLRDVQEDKPRKPISSLIQLLDVQEDEPYINTLSLLVFSRCA